MALVSNELLAFVQHVVNTMDEDSIVQLCRSTYTSEEICKGRLMRYEALGKTAQMKSRRRDGSERSLQDIISLLKVQTNPAELPVFVAKQLHKLPPVSTNHVNVSSLLQKFNIMRAELDEIRGRLDASESTISPGSTKPATITKKSLHNLTILVITSNSSMSHRKYNYYQMDKLARDPHLDWSKKTLMFVGGFMSSPFFPYSSNMGSAYKKLGYNVLMLDTLEYTTMEYPLASRFARVVGKHTAEMLAQLTKKGLNPKNFELMGMSLGGQTISFIAKNYRNLTGTGLGKLIALEPAGPCFRNLGPKDRLDKSDADFVLHVATNIDGYGMATPLGHVTFYVNGGEHQPGEILWFFCPDICSHSRSFDIWQSALRNPDDFIGIQCDTVQQARNKDCFDRAPRVTNLLGPKTDRNVEGVFYVSTTNREPYCMGKRGLKKENDFFLSLSASLNADDNLKL